jgi:hypothetical protein
MRPNLALGPIDSVQQYLLYLSIVVLGVLLPLLANKWRTRREQAALLARTLLALQAEVAANRRRVASSRETLVHLRDQLDQLRAHRHALRLRLDDPTQPEPPQPPDDSDWGVNVPMVTRTAWDVAQLSGALPLLTEAQLNTYTRAYQMQTLFERDRSALLDTLMRIEELNLPADIRRPETLDAQLRLLIVALATLRYQVGLADGMIEAFDAAKSPGASP